MRTGNCAIRSLGLLRDCSVFLDALQRNGPNVTQQAVGELAVIAVHNHTADALCSNQTLYFTNGVRRGCVMLVTFKPLAEQCTEAFASTPVLPSSTPPSCMKASSC